MDLIFIRQARKDKKSIPEKELKRIHQALTILQDYPNTQNLDIKKLQSSRLMRLRVGNYRITFEIEQDIIYIHAIQRRTSTTYQ